MKHPFADLLARFPDENAIRTHLAKLRWGNQVQCPVCNSDDVLTSSTGYECRACRRNRQRKSSSINTSLFTVMTGTYLEDTRSMKSLVLFLHVWLHFKQGAVTYRMARSTGMSHTNCIHHMNRVSERCGEAGVARGIKLDDALKALLMKRTATPTKMVA